MQAELRIRSTLARYNLAGDRGRIEELAATFVPGGILESPAWRLEGREAIIAELRRLSASTSPSLTRVRHHLTTSAIDIVASDRAEAISYFMVVTDIGLDHSGSYRDRLLRVGDDWLFEHRSSVIDWASPDTLFALDAFRPASGNRR